MVVSLKSKYLSNLQTEYIYHYTFLMLFGLTFLISARQFWIVFGDFVDFRLFSILFVLSFFLLSDNFIKNWDNK